MSAAINIRADRSVGELQKDFSNAYPYLKIDFYKINGKQKYTTAERMDDRTLLKSYGLLSEGKLELKDSMTVLELERALREIYGAYIQVSRKSGSVWLETTMTDNWTLKQQNDHGKELSEPVKNLEDEIDYT